MKTKFVRVRVPATTANLGPGFDCLGMALDLWNETTIMLQGDGIQVVLQGYGEGMVPTDERNLVVKAFLLLFKKLGVQAPPGLKVQCNNNIPLGSGLGSSCAAVLSGLMAANACLGNPVKMDELLLIASEMEGHPDNVSAAALGGLVACIAAEKSLITRRYKPAAWYASVIIPIIQLPTVESRAVLPINVSLKDAVFNMGHTLLVVDAICNGDRDLLSQSMQDRLHQPYRLRLIPGANAAFQAALQAGAVATAISGAGPGLIAFSLTNSKKIMDAMQSEMNKESINSLAFELKVTCQKAEAVYGNMMI